MSDLKLVSGIAGGRPQTFDEAWRVAESLGTVKIGPKLFGDEIYEAEITFYRGRKYHSTRVQALGSSTDAFAALCKAVEEAWELGARPGE